MNAKRTLFSLLADETIFEQLSIFITKNKYKNKRIKTTPFLVISLERELNKLHGKIVINPKQLLIQTYAPIMN